MQSLVANGAHPKFLCPPCRPRRGRGYPPVTKNSPTSKSHFGEKFILDEVFRSSRYDEGQLTFYGLSNDVYEISVAHHLTWLVKIRKNVVPSLVMIHH